MVHTVQQAVAHLDVCVMHVCPARVPCSANEAGLGVRCMSWSPGGDVLAVGGYDQVRCSGRGVRASTATY